MRTNGFLSCVLAVGVTVFGAGCALGGETSADSHAAQALTTSYEGVSVDSEIDASGVVRATPRSAEGDALLVLRVEGDRIEIQPLADKKLAPWSGTVPAGVEKDLSDWSLIAYAYSAGLRAPSEETGGLRVLRQSAGTDGQMCIAAGGTLAECTYWLYCRRNWCPFW